MEPSTTEYKYKVGDWITWSTNEVPTFTKGKNYRIEHVTDKKLYVRDDNGQSDYWYYGNFPSQYFTYYKNGIVQEIINDLL